MAQDGEAVAAAQAARNGAPGPRLAHYFSGGEDDFFAKVGR
jgi:hypothetical protein